MKFCFQRTQRTTLKKTIMRMIIPTPEPFFFFLFPFFLSFYTNRLLTTAFFWTFKTLLIRETDII